ncbi:MAG: lipoprotein NlpI [Verrucomicrobia bacterium]|nr:lipoprotein NlpI [Verrucomicrobiota bacterium]
MLAKIEDVLKRGKKTDAPAYTLILGAGASFGVVPTAKEMLGFPDSKSGTIHDKSVPLWLAKQMEPDAPHEGNDLRQKCSKEFWRQFVAENAGNPKCSGIKIGEDGFPVAASIAAAYQAVFETSCIGGLDTPERHRSYMREVTMVPGAAQLNATHFYLASLLSLQKRTGEPGSDKKPLYTGRREFARTIFTTNFDPLLQTSLQLFQLLYYMTDRPEFLSADALQTDHHPAMHLFYAHGSVHRPYMANTDEQIALLKQQNARDLAAYLGSHGVIVLGYSGWDDCLLEALNQTKTFSNNLYWLARGGGSISESVGRFLGTHPNAYWVEIADGGSFMAELHGLLCPGAPNTEMLYNPIRSMLTQLECVSLSGVQSGQKLDKSDCVHAVLDAPLDVEQIRMQVIERLKDAQKHFAVPLSGKFAWEELERQAGLSYANNDWDAALTGYSQLVNIKTSFPVDKRALALYRRAYCYHKKGDVDKGIEGYTAVIDLFEAPVTQIARARVGRALAYGTKNDTKMEAEDYTAVINLIGAPVEQISQALFNRGVIYSEKGESEEAIKDYTAAIELRGASLLSVARARLNRGIQYSKKNELDKAMEDYTVVIGFPDVSAEVLAKARVSRAAGYILQGKKEKAIEDCTLVIEASEIPAAEVAVARSNRGLVYSDKNEIDKAIEDYTAVIELVGAPADLVKKANDKLNKLRKTNHKP